LEVRGLDGLFTPTTKLKLKGAIFFCGGKGKPDDFFAEST